ncbi:uncharacterized protein BP01DRAFT_357218 [Aspergillus saccharolyticus JOP 1030-1]|uniref:DUF7514 domain-containing protein n=1 Tax=Aspergillus saccharolyticus JOP 1030-1 TaxID=1450539 RepID=A0A318ZC15_9EURO|nr:hypothetical protein BP01DRAFT_357218 [Aspergillus saccharolyticus JOP 1030-1]PYH44869.1 hypothetical protein BP01DRAFT_357218 [Aspergillus saccharolyticus JOP 1030-1]
MAYNGFSNNGGSYPQYPHASHLNANENRASAFTPPYPVQYPAQYGPDQSNIAQPQVPPRPSSPGNYYNNPSYDPNAWQQPQQQPPAGRINEAVNSAFRQAETPAYLSPDVVSQITATVIQQLKATGLDGLHSEQQPPASSPQWAPPPPQSTGPTYGEPTYPTAAPQAAPPPPPPKVGPDHSDYPTPVPPAGRPVSPHLYPGASSGPSTDRRGSPASQVSDHNHTVDSSRPKPPSRDVTVTEMTTLEKIWGKLFVKGKPTERLGQLLRGVAVHLIEDYPPGNTLVVTPEKLQKFYEDTAVTSDPYPWQDIFDDRTSSISRLFREVEAEHHLVQNKLNERPDIPGLTPRGFERWATLMIQAHPDKEYERFQKAVLNMPINNPDNRRERFPKEIPRRLFPSIPDLSLREEVDQFIMRHCGVDLPPISEEELRHVAEQRHKKAAHKASVSSVESTPSLSDRERQPYHTSSATASTAAVVDDDEDQEVPSRPIERQRKPYTAQPGGGKVYEEGGSGLHRHAGSTTSSGPRDSPTLSATRVADQTYTQDAHHYRVETPSSQRPATAFARPRSPRSGNGGTDYRHSESDLLAHSGNTRYPGASDGEYYYSSNSSALPGDIIEDRRRYKDLDPETQDQRLYEAIRERDKEKKRSSWGGDEDYYRSNPVSSTGSAGYDYKTYGYR